MTASSRSSGVTTRAGVRRALNLMNCRSRRKYGKNDFSGGWCAIPAVSGCPGKSMIPGMRGTPLGLCPRIACQPSGDSVRRGVHLRTGAEQVRPRQAKVRAQRNRFDVVYHDGGRYTQPSVVALGTLTERVLIEPRDAEPSPLAVVSNCMSNCVRECALPGHRG